MTHITKRRVHTETKNLMALEAIRVVSACERLLLASTF